MCTVWKSTRPIIYIHIYTVHNLHTIYLCNIKRIVLIFKIQYFIQTRYTWYNLLLYHFYFFFSKRFNLLFWELKCGATNKLCAHLICIAFGLCATPQLWTLCVHSSSAHVHIVYLCINIFMQYNRGYVVRKNVGNVACVQLGDIFLINTNVN